MKNDDYYRYDDYLDEDCYRDRYDYQGSQEMTREEKFWFVLVLTVFILALLGGAFSGVFYF